MAKRIITDSELFYLGDKVVMLGKNELRESMHLLVKGIREIQKSMTDDKSSAELDELVECVLACKEPPEYGKRDRSDSNVTCYIDKNNVVIYRPKAGNFLYWKKEDGRNHYRLIEAEKQTTDK